MGRLIDADALAKVLKRTSVFECIRNSADKNVFEIIDAQPTAYDVEKVVKELENTSCLIQSDEGCGWLNFTEDAIEIVRKGGVE